MFKLQNSQYLVYSYYSTDVIKALQNTWNDLLLFLKKPKDQKDHVQSLSLKGQRLFSVLAIDILIMILLTLLIGLLEQAGVYSLEDHQLFDLLKLPPLQILLLGVLLLPFIEELIFRLYLRLPQNIPLQSFIIIASFTGQKNKEKLKAYIEQRWRTYYKIIFYLAAFIFALVHISNFEYSITLLAFTPLLVAPQFAVGLFTGYLRVKYGFIWGFYLHALHNLIAFGVTLLFMGEPVEKLAIENEQYSLKIEEVIRAETATLMFSSDAVRVEGVTFKTLLAKLMNKEEKLISVHGDEPSQQINLTFEAYADSLNANQVVLDQLQDAYNFTITKKPVLKGIWMLQIADTTRLMSHKSDSANSSKIDISAKNISMTNADTKQLVETLNANYDEYLSTSVTLSDKFDFEISRVAFDTLMNSLQNKYGLMLTKDTMQIEQVDVYFEDQ